MKCRPTRLADALCVSPVSAASTWATTIDAATYGGSSGTIKFNDWGCTGLTGVGASDFQVGAGFDAGNIGQRQHVATQNPDYASSDPGHTVVGDLMNTPTDANATMDGGVNFYQWGDTTQYGGTFGNMQIDKAGNYHVAKTDMSFRGYDTFEYRDTTGVNPNRSRDTLINFKPYTVSDARGWCGSVLSADPGGLSQTAGRVTFDFAIDVYFDFGSESFSSTELAPGFVMRSYGDYEVNVSTSGGIRQQFYGSAVGNNTNPESIVPGVGGALDPDYQNLVSFLGAGVLSAGVWVSADSFNADGSRKMRIDFNPTTGESREVWDVTIVEAGTAGAVWHKNAYGGFAYLLRADGMRILDSRQPGGALALCGQRARTRDLGHDAGWRGYGRRHGGAAAQARPTNRISTWVSAGVPVVVMSRGGGGSLGAIRRGMWFFDRQFADREISMMKFAKTILAVALGAASTGALAAPLAWTGTFAMYNPLGVQLDANDGASGVVALVTGFIDVTAGTFSLASTDTFFGVPWTTSGGTLFGPGTYTVSTVDPAPGVSGGSYTFTVGAGQMGGVIDFAWGATSGIDVVMVWNVVNSHAYTSTDWDGDGIPGAGMIDGPFLGFSANFNMEGVLTPPDWVPEVPAIPEASTYAMMLAGLGVVGLAVCRRKQEAKG